MSYEPLYHTRAWRPVKPELFLYIVTFRLFLQNKIGKIYQYILKFTRQPGGQSDIVWSYTGLQI